MYSLHNIIIIVEVKPTKLANTKLASMAEKLDVVDVFDNISLMTDVTGGTTTCQPAEPDLAATICQLVDTDPELNVQLSGNTVIIEPNIIATSGNSSNSSCTGDISSPSLPFPSLDSNTQTIVSETALSCFESSNECSTFCDAVQITVGDVTNNDQTLLVSNESVSPSVEDCEAKCKENASKCVGEDIVEDTTASNLNVAHFSLLDDTSLSSEESCEISQVSPVDLSSGSDEIVDSSSNAESGNTAEAPIYLSPSVSSSKSPQEISSLNISNSEEKLHSVKSDLDFENTIVSYSVTADTADTNDNIIDQREEQSDLQQTSSSPTNSAHNLDCIAVLPANVEDPGDSRQIHWCLQCDNLALLDDQNKNDEQCRNGSSSVGSTPTYEHLPGCQHFISLCDSSELKENLDEVNRSRTDHVDIRSFLCQDRINVDVLGTASNFLSESRQILPQDLEVSDCFSTVTPVICKNNNLECVDVDSSCNDLHPSNVGTNSLPSKESDILVETGVDFVKSDNWSHECKTEHLECPISVDILLPSVGSENVQSVSSDEQNSSNMFKEAYRHSNIDKYQSEGSNSPDALKTNASLDVVSALTVNKEAKSEKNQPRNTITDPRSFRCDASDRSPLQSESIDMSCGFSTLSSVLFEKCKYRRDPTTSNEAALCSQLQQCSLSDTPLYVHDAPAGSSEKNKNNREVEYPISIQKPALRMAKSFHALSGLPERRLGVFGSFSNPCIIEESEESHSSKLYESDDSLQETSNSIKTRILGPTDKVPSYRHIEGEVLTATTSAPCSPVPVQSGIFAAERRRKHNTCVRRRVSFPEDDTRLITSYLEPVDPWERMKTSVTSEEVMRAYLNSCSTHGCSPISAVVNQIYALPLNIPGRIGCFSLKGTKLELSQCEGLEEILKRVQFVCVDLEGCLLTDETVIPLVDMIEFYDSATQLNISCNTGIASRGWQACARMLKKNQSVRYLDARSTNLNEVNMPILGKALRLGARLHTLHLENCNLTGRPLITLAAALKFNDCLVKLYLADNRLGSSDSIQIGNLLRANLTLKLLDLRNNNLQDSGCALVCEGVGEQSKPSASSNTGLNKTKSNNPSQTGLNSLVLWNNHMTVSSAKHLALMVNCTTSLETLNIGRNSITNDGIICLKESLLRNKSLKRLYLYNTKVADEGAVALAEFIADSKNIERVDLRDNTIKVAGLLALAHSLRHNSSVVQIDLDSKPRSEPNEELSEKHSSLLIEIKDYAHRNRTRLHINMTAESGKDSDAEDYNLDPDFRKLSLSSEISPDGPPPLSLEVPVSSTATTKLEDHKKYRSPSPSPCASPILSPSPSPTPSPMRNRFKVFKVSPHDPPSSPTGSHVIVTTNPLFGGSNNVTLSSSAPGSSLPVSRSNTSRPVFYQPKAVTRNRFLSGGGRFTVTKVTDSLSSLPNTKSTSLPFISQSLSSSSLSVSSEPSSPKIVISSPAKIERGFSLDDESPVKDEEPETSKDVNTNQASYVPNLLSASNSSIASSQAFMKAKTDSTESDDVFVDSVTSQTETVKIRKSIAKSESCFRGLSPNTGSRRELTDSGFLEEPNSEFEDALSTFTSKPTSFRDDDRDSLFSNTSDPDGNSPLHPVPPVTKSAALPTLSADIPQLLVSPSLKKSEPDISFMSFKPAQIRKSPVSSRMELKCSKNDNTLTQPFQRAPLASMENGSFDTDSEDSELTTQSSDSTHSDEVRINVEQCLPQQAWCTSSKDDNPNIHKGVDSFIANPAIEHKQMAECGSRELIEKNLVETVESSNSDLGLQKEK